MSPPVLRLGLHQEIHHSNSRLKLGRNSESRGGLQTEQFQPEQDSGSEPEPGQPQLLPSSHHTLSQTGSHIPDGLHGEETQNQVPVFPQSLHDGGRRD